MNNEVTFFPNTQLKILPSLVPDEKIKLLVTGEFLLTVTVTFTVSFVDKIMFPLFLTPIITCFNWLIQVVDEGEILAIATSYLARKNENIVDRYTTV